MVFVGTGAVWVASSALGDVLAEVVAFREAGSRVTASRLRRRRFSLASRVFWQSELANWARSLVTSEVGSRAPWAAANWASSPSISTVKSVTAVSY